MGFDVKGQLLIIYSAFVKYSRKKWEYNETMHQLFVNFKEAYDSVRGAVFYNILVEFGIPLKIARLIKICLNYSRGRVGKQLSDNFPTKNVLKQRDALSPLLFNFALEYALSSVQANQKILKLNGTH